MEALYMSIVAAMIGPESFWKFISNCSLTIHQSRIVWKMRCIDGSSNGVYAMTLKWRAKRGVIGLRPPPGGPIAQTNEMSTSLRKTFSLRSYQPPWSMNWRRISMGGCAPYVSSAGMLRSSTKMTERLPTGGPKTPFLRLSSLASMMSCDWLADVCAEKLRKIVCHASDGSRSSSFCTYDVLPVPVGPTKSDGMPCASSLSRMNVYRAVSSVGTIICENSAFAGILVSSLAIVSTHMTHLCLTWSKTSS
mmetsp:Transcript_14668/g.43744  ORF Transcript_14668/g.43744 Transcript_14668/m.43744 type:complete len:249 (-) Transcript_14668:1443-2189(-)